MFAIFHQPRSIFQLWWPLGGLRCTSAVEGRWIYTTRTRFAFARNIANGIECTLWGPPTSGRLLMPYRCTTYRMNGGVSSGHEHADNDRSRSEIHCVWIWCWCVGPAHVVSNGPRTNGASLGLVPSWRCIRSARTFLWCIRRVPPSSWAVRYAFCMLSIFSEDSKFGLVGTCGLMRLLHPLWFRSRIDDSAFPIARCRSGWATLLGDHRCNPGKQHNSAVHLHTRIWGAPSVPCRRSGRGVGGVWRLARDGNCAVRIRRWTLGFCIAVRKTDNICASSGTPRSPHRPIPVRTAGLQVDRPRDNSLSDQKRNPAFSSARLSAHSSAPSSHPAAWGWSVGNSLGTSPGVSRDASRCCWWMLSRTSHVRTWRSAVWQRTAPGIHTVHEWLDIADRTDTFQWPVDADAAAILRIGLRNWYEQLGRPRFVRPCTANNACKSNLQLKGDWCSKHLHRFEFGPNGHCRSSSRTA